MLIFTGLLLISVIACIVFIFMANWPFALGFAAIAGVCFYIVRRS